MYVALGIALLAGFDSIPNLMWLIQTVRTDWTNIQQFEGITFAAKIVQWALNTSIAPQISNLLTIFAEQSLMLLCFALFRQPDLDNGEMRRSDLLHDVAIVGIIIGSLLLIGRVAWSIYNIGQYDYWRAVRPDIVTAKWRWVILNLRSLPSSILPLAIPVIILKGEPGAADQLPHPVEITG